MPSPPSGSAEHETIVQSYPGERATIDTSFPEFRTANDQWELDPNVDLDAGAPPVYRTKAVDSRTDLGVAQASDFMGGFFELNGERVALGTYRQIERLRTTEERYSPQGAYYAGPGIYWGPDGAAESDGGAVYDGRIYIRLTPPDAGVLGGDSLPSFPSTNPNEVPLFISRACEGVDCNAVPMRGSYLRFRHLDVYHGGVAFRTWDTNRSNLSFEDIAIHAVQAGVQFFSANQLSVTDSLIDCHRPPWFAWNDVKRNPPYNIGLVASDAIGVGNSSHVTFEGNVVRQCFDGVHAAGGLCNDDFRFRNNVFSDILDDGTVIVATNQHVEISGNKYVGPGARGLGIQFAATRQLVCKNDGGCDGGVDSGVDSGAEEVDLLAACGFPEGGVDNGTNHFHHNVIHATPYFSLRVSIDGGLPVREARSAFATHNTEFQDAAPSPWNVYNNTLVEVVQDGGSLPGFNVQYSGVGTPIHRHQVFNNIIEIVGVGQALGSLKVDTAAEVYDGNNYWRTNAQSPPYLLYPLNGNTAHGFAKLDDFRSDAGYSSYRCATTSYYAPGWEAFGVEADPRLAHGFVPAFDGPAGSGAVSLGGFGLPGVDGRRYRGAIPPSSGRVIGSWSLQNTSTTDGLKDTGGYAHATSALGTPTTVTGHDGTGSGLHFDGAAGIAITRQGAGGADAGADAQGSSGPDPLVGMEKRSFTFATYFKWGTLQNPPLGILFSNRGSGASLVQIGTHSSGAPGLDGWIGTARYYFSLPFFPTTDWHHFMASVSVRSPWDYEVNFFIDHQWAGGEDHRIAGEKHLVPSASPELFVGTLYPGVGGWTGDLDEVRLFAGAVGVVDGSSHDNSPIAYFDFTPSGAPVGLDLSGEGSTGSFYNGATTTSDGFDRDGLDMPSSGGGFQINKAGRLAKLGDGPFTISLWFRGGGAGGFLFRNRAPGNALIQAYRPSYSNQTLQVTIGDTNYHRGDFFAPVLDSAWHLFTLTVDGSHNLAVYLDGHPQPRMDHTHKISGNLALTSGGAELHIGASHPGVGTHLGQIDEVRVFDYVRAPTIPVPSVLATCP
jgi:hypothetical protein